MIRYKKDYIAVSIVALALSSQVAALSMGAPLWLVVVILPLLRWVNLAEHNHVHLPIFRKGFANRLLDWCFFLSNGVSTEIYHEHHVVNHHVYNQKVESDAYDWSSLYGFKGTVYPRVPVNKLYYVITFTFLCYCHFVIEVIRNPRSPLFYRALWSFLVVRGACVALLLIDPVRFLVFFVAPWVIVFLFLGKNNYEHHVGCQMTSPLDSSITDLTFLHRALGFNIGYHTAHHMKPGLHWSLLPQYHERIADQIPPENYVV